MGKIGEVPSEQATFFENVVAAFPDVSWIDGRPPTMVIHYQAETWDRVEGPRAYPAVAV